jgi:hypothetical protein
MVREAAVIFLRGNEPVKKYLERLTRKHGKGKALWILAHRLGRAVYFMLKHKEGGIRPPEVLPLSANLALTGDHSWSSLPLMRTVGGYEIISMSQEIRFCSRS